MKSCTSCKEEKEISEFYARSDLPHKTTSHCAACIVKKTTAYQQKIGRTSEIKARAAAATRKYNALRPERVKGSNLRRYWPSLDWRGALAEFNRLFAEQSGCCKICNKHQSQLRQAICVDHCSETGQVRGLLCHECNRAIGMLRHDVGILQSALDYLEDTK